ncbi:MAG: cobalamin biosynthesis protein [Solirubrobacteraceae bacterium MAG38_C4-C5]|nr:cobalamin biosynthesis protein [Candidatus Siliceabacter maunaloa]
MRGGRGGPWLTGARTVACAGSARRDVATGLAVGALADRLVRDPARGHPVALFGAVAAALERITHHPSRLAGVGHVTLLVGGGAVTVRHIERVAPRLLVTAAVTWAALGGRSLEREAAALARLLEAGDLDGARGRLPALVGRDPTGLPADELCRAAVESVAENTADAVVAPLLWGAVAGPAGVVVHRAANTLDAMVGHHSPRYERFGWAAARLDDALGWPPARLGAVLAAALAPLVGGDALTAWRTLRRDGAAHPSPNAGRLEAAFAGALGVRLGGTNRYPSHVEHRPFLGGGRVPTPDDVRRAARLSRAVGAASAALALAGSVRPHRRAAALSRAGAQPLGHPPLGALSALCADKAPSATRGRP